MQYFGGKERVSRSLSKFINENYLKGNNKSFYDLFCGSCNVLTKIDNNRNLIGNDIHKYLISMWKELQNGWIPPKTISELEYKNIKNNMDLEPYLSGFVGFGCSYSGKWWGGYARDKNNRNYCLNAYNSTMKKLEKLKNVDFYSLDYSELNIKNGSVVYCDIPYKNTTQYSVKECGEFDHEKFYKWCLDNKNNFTILISEYKHNVPEGFEIVWEMESKKDIRDKNGVQQKTLEILMKPIDK